MTHSHYTIQKVRMLKASGLSISAISKQTGISRSTVGYWLYPNVRSRGVEYNRIRRQEQPEKHRAEVREYRVKNHDKVCLSVISAASVRGGYAPPAFSWSELKDRRESHSGLCDICGRVEKPLHVDHCHATGAFRGLLCHKCNSALGLMRDDPVLLETAARYLRACQTRVS